MTVCPALMLSPGFTVHCTIFPLVIVDESAGIITSANSKLGRAGALLGAAAGAAAAGAAAAGAAAVGEAPAASPACTCVWVWIGRSGVWHVYVAN